MNRIKFGTCSGDESSMCALKQATIRVVAVMGEGLAEAETKQLIAYARSNNKVEVDSDLENNLNIIYVLFYNWSNYLFHN